MTNTSNISHISGYDSLRSESLFKVWDDGRPHRIYAEGNFFLHFNEGPQRTCAEGNLTRDLDDDCWKADSNASAHVLACLSASHNVSISCMCSDREFVEPKSSSFSKKTSTLLYRYAGRDEVRRLTSESASAFKKNDDTAYTHVKLVHLL